MQAYIKDTLVVVISSLMFFAMSPAWGAGGVVTGPNTEAPDRRAPRAPRDLGTQRANGGHGYGLCYRAFPQGQ
jgi:hypothetical protein